MNWDEFTRQWHGLRSQMLAMVRNATDGSPDDGARGEHVPFGEIQVRSGGLVDDAAKHIDDWAASSSRNADSTSNNKKVE